MGIKKSLAAVLTAGMMMTFVPATAMAATTGWQGSDSSGWRYYTTSSQYIKNNWKQIGGKWYYFNSNGYMESNCYRDGCWLTKTGEWDTKCSHGTWKSNSNGWWYEDNGWYPKSRWLWIDGNCYYFDSKGFMEYNCYRDGCYLTKSGAWDRRYSHGTWKQDSTGWWYEDNGWYPKNQWLWIDGAKYWFGSNGYWIPAGKPTAKVTDAVNKTYTYKTYTYTQKIPQVTISGRDMSSVNNKIYKDALPDKSDHIYSISYSSYVDDGIVSIKMEKNLGGYYGYHDIAVCVYNISVETGKFMSSSEVVKQQGLTDSAFFSTVKKFYDTYKNTNSIYSTDPNYKKWYQENYDRMSYDYITPFISSDGHFCFVSFNMRVYGGSDCAHVIFDTVTGEYDRL